MVFKKAVKYGAKLRLALAGPAGSGKTYTALTLALALANGGTVALIDTEHGSASKYADIFSEFDTKELTTFHPQKYIDAIHEAEQAGYAVLVIDSLSHAWSGQGGLLEEKDKIARSKYNGNSFSAWNDASALQNKLVNVILGSSLHIIATVRSKMEYVLETNERGKQQPRKVGMAPVQRDDLPYEFDVFCTMESDNTLLVEKSRCPQLSGAVIPKPDAKVADILKSWLMGEIPPESPQLATVPTNGASPSTSPQTNKAMPASQSEESGVSSGNLAQLITKAQSRANKLGLANDLAGWYAFVQECLGEPLRNADIQVHHIGRINGKLTQLEKERAAA